MSTKTMKKIAKTVGMILIGLSMALGSLSAAGYLGKYSEMLVVDTPLQAAWRMFIIGIMGITLMCVFVGVTLACYAPVCMSESKDDDD